MKIEATLPKAFVENVKKRGDKPFLFHKKGGAWLAVSWNEVSERVKHISLGLMSLGVEKGDRIAPISETRPEMVYVCLAIATSGAIFAPIYHTNSPKECAHVINDSGSGIAYAEDQTQLDKLKIAWPDCPNLEKIIVFKQEKPENDPRIITLDRVMELGKEEFQKNGDRAYYERVDSIKPEDLTTVIYTSGTTGPPKGVMLTIGGMIKNLAVLTELFPVSGSSRGISVLPMAHQLELMNGHWYHVLYGFPQVYAESIRTLYEDVREMKPTFFFTAPRFYEKIYNEMTAHIEACPPWKKRLILWCLSVGAQYQDMKYGPNKGITYGVMKLLNALGHTIFFHKVHATVGGKMEWSSTGSAPIPAKILLFFRACDFPIYEGYGLTESAGTVSLNEPGAVKVGTVGKPSRGLEVTIAGDGEILVKGWARCAGYWNKPEATAELFADGWLHTGDLGFLDEDGFLHITGRKKEVLITSTGKNITPANIQVLLKTSPYIAETVVFGEGKTYLTAIVTLDEESITQYAKERNIAYSDFAGLTRHQAIIELVGREIEEKNRELARIEQIKKFTILEDQFRQDREEIGPTMKVKRKVVEQRYKDKIEAMYAKE
jgi:long-chain acyl-CoA synthetase